MRKNVSEKKKKKKKKHLFMFRLELSFCDSCAVSCVTDDRLTTVFARSGESY